MGRPTDAELDAYAERVATAAPRFTPEQLTHIGLLLDSAPASVEPASDECPDELLGGAA